MDFNSFFGVVNSIIDGYIGIFNSNPILGIIFIAASFIGIFVVLAYLSAKFHGSLKTIAIILFIVFVMVILTILYKEYSIGVDLSHSLMNITNVTNFTH